MKKRSNVKFSFFTKLLLLVNCVAALGLLVSYLAPMVDPRKFWPVAFFGLAYPPLLLVNVIFIVYWLFSRAKLALISVIAVLLGGNVLLNNIGFSFPDKDVKRSAGNLRVLTYNVHNFKKGGVKDDDSTRHGILRIIKNLEPDVVAFQEFYTRKKGRYAMKDSISVLNNAPHSYAEANMESTQEVMGTAIFSRFPIVSKGSVTIGEKGSGNQCIYADIKLGDEIVRFYSIHLQSIGFGQQDYQYLDTITRSGKADILSTRRLGSKLKHAFLKRAGQVHTIKQHAAQSPYPYVLAGDFNDTPSSFAVNQMGKGIQNTFRKKGFGFGRTYNGDFPNYQIDYIMASNSFNVLSYNIVKQKISDHYPVYADLALK